MAATLILACGLAACASNPAPGIGTGTGTGIMRARLVYVADGVLFRTRLDEAMLARSGCTCASSDPAALRALRHLLDGVRFDPAPDGQPMIEPRYALYLDTGDGSTTTLLLDRQYNGPPVRYGTLDGKPIAVTGSLAPQLVQWAAHANLVQSNAHCTANAPGSGPANAHF